MVERGGPTTQAGIHYQNSVAALCLGDLLLWDVVNPAERVVEVGLEAPADVDDIVVRHADGHRNWIQVKLDLEPRCNAWEKLWTDLAQQRDHDLFGVEDRLVFVCGSVLKLNPVQFHSYHCFVTRNIERRGHDWRRSAPHQSLSFQSVFR